MKAIIYQPRKNAKRIKVYIPYKVVVWRQQMKTMPTSFFHYEQKLWSVVNTVDNFTDLKKMFGDQHSVQKIDEKPALPEFTLKQAEEEVLLAMHKKLILQGKSPHTQKSYSAAFARFLSYFSERALREVTKAEIEGFIFHLKSKYHLSDTQQNTLINAIKFYYEQVLGMPREYYDITRPKQRDTLPNVLSVEEVKTLINTPKNIKHKAILYTVYSAGLRLSELLRLRIEDVRSDDGYLFVKDAKGKKDRKTVLSPVLLNLLRSYYREHKPAYWLFEGQDGGQYSASSINKIFRAAIGQSGINPWATLHTLRHSFATHLLQQGTNLWHIQVLLGHYSSKTTEIYTHVMNINNKSVRSPLDAMYDITNLQNRHK